MAKDRSIKKIYLTPTSLSYQKKLIKSACKLGSRVKRHKKTLFQRYTKRMESCVVSNGIRQTYGVNTEAFWRKVPHQPTTDTYRRCHTPEDNIVNQAR